MPLSVYRLLEIHFICLHDTAVSYVNRKKILESPKVICDLRLGEQKQLKVETFFEDLLFSTKNCNKKAALLGGLVSSKECLTFTHSLPNRHCLLINDNNKDEAKKDKANNDVKECKHMIFQF